MAKLLGAAPALRVGEPRKLEQDGGLTPRQGFPNSVPALALKGLDC
jgi:hypothetical protein